MPPSYTANASNTQAGPSGVAIITGAAQGIGRAVALRLALHDGYDVTLTDLPSNTHLLNELKELILVKSSAAQHQDSASSRKGFWKRKSSDSPRSSSSTAAASSRRIHIVTGDVSVEKDVKRIVDETASVLGSVDVMVANAGIAFAKSFLETTTEDWDRIFSINVRGTFLCYKYAAKQMIKQGKGGRIVGATSGCGFSGIPYLAGYGATKWAIRGITATAALEFGPHGITVNAYAPSAVDTALSKGLAATFGMDPEEFSADDENEGSLVRKGTVEDIAALVSYLVSKEAHFTTGQCIVMNGGK